jgi:hypothetical protein
MDKVLKVLSLVPALIEVIKAVEAMFPQSGAGKEKLALVREIMVEAYVGITEMWPTIEAIIGKIVAMANRLGEFKKS